MQIIKTAEFTFMNGRKREKISFNMQDAKFVSNIIDKTKIFMRYKPLIAHPEEIEYSTRIKKMEFLCDDTICEVTTVTGEIFHLILK